METLAEILKSTGATLVVRNGGITRTFSRRGVADLMYILDTEPALLRGASVADKIIGKAAAALMTLGGVKDVYTPKITQAAIDIFSAHGIDVTYGIIVPFIENRDHTGRCPIDTLCAPLSDIHEIHRAIVGIMDHGLGKKDK